MWAADAARHYPASGCPRAATQSTLRVASAVVTGLVGGASPKIQIDTTTALAVPIPPNAVDVTILKEVAAGSDQSTLGTITNAGIYTPHHAVDASATYAFVYSTIAPTRWAIWRAPRSGTSRRRPRRPTRSSTAAR